MQDARFQVLTEARARKVSSRMNMHGMSRPAHETRSVLASIVVVGATSDDRNAIASQVQFAAIDEAVAAAASAASGGESGGRKAKKPRAS